MSSRFRIGFLSVFAVLAAFHVGAGKVCARPDKAKDPEPEPPARSVEGTVWSGIDSDGAHYTFRFRKGGVLSYTSPSGTFHTGSTWKQTGNSIYWEIGKKYSEYRGTIKGKWMEGSASNVDRLKWTWKVKKQ
jgi:hypothetical protein